MSQDLNTAMMLMGIGMITVFFVLLCVVVTGKMLISFVNKYVPQAEAAGSGPGSDIPANKVAAITSAINTLTGGKGKITNIKKL